MSEMGGFLPDRFWAAELGKRPFRWPLHFDSNAPQGGRSHTLCVAHKQTLRLEKKTESAVVRPEVAGKSDREVLQLCGIVVAGAGDPVQARKARCNPPSPKGNIAGFSEEDNLW
jgi:hypothetical protein